MTREDLLKGLTKEQKEKLENCKTTEELINVAKKEGIELTDEQLEAVTGGFCDSEEDNTKKKDDGKRIKEK
jgi:hypothetical protein